MIQAVRIKSWEQMEKEYGLNSCSAINCKYAFTKEMEYLCNTIIIIDSITHVDSNDNWSISNDMIAEYLDINDYPEYYI